MLKKIGRLFVIKTRLEAFLVTYAIAVGAMARGVTYLQQYPGWPGYLLMSCCLGLPFVAGAKLLDAVRPPQPARAPAMIAPRRRRAAVRHRRYRRTSDTPRTQSRRRA